MSKGIPKKDNEALNELVNAFFKELPDIAAKLSKIDSIPLGIMEIKEYFTAAYNLGLETGEGIKKELVKLN